MNNRSYVLVFLIWKHSSVWVSTGRNTH